uniref:Uncharacterized protein n=1 Tax=Trichobilharzia regenti TaxID=157069 RepID=A0AA85K109_TRIRE|nr:unnamed protein product [Trichobilharzia regenti]
MRLSLRLFSDAYTNIEFTTSHENDGKFHFLSTAIQCLEDCSLQKSIRRKLTWEGQYLHFYSFCSKSKEIMLYREIRVRIYVFSKILKSNGYPQRFINKYRESESSSIKQITVRKNPIYIQLDFKGEDIAAVVNRRLKTSLATAYSAAKLVRVC